MTGNNAGFVQLFLLTSKGKNIRYSRILEFELHRQGQNLYHIYCVSSGYFNSFVQYNFQELRKMNKTEPLTLSSAHGSGKERAGKHTYIFSKNRRVKIQTRSKSIEYLK